MKGSRYDAELAETRLSLVEEANWESVRKHGLLPASLLIERAGEQEAMKRTHRATHTVLSNGVHIRDQKPMSPKALASCLRGMTPEEWYMHINSHVFFWLDQDRLERQQAACGSRPQRILIINTDRLIDACAANLFLTPINTGNARRKPAARGAATFVPYKTWLETGWESEAHALGATPRPRSHAPVELAVQGSAPNIAQLIDDQQNLS